MPGSMACRCCALDRPGRLLSPCTGLVDPSSEKALNIRLVRHSNLRGGAARMMRPNCLVSGWLLSFTLAAPFLETVRAQTSTEEKSSRSVDPSQKGVPASPSRTPGELLDGYLSSGRKSLQEKKYREAETVFRTAMIIAEKTSVNDERLAK